MFIRNSMEEFFRNSKEHFFFTMDDMPKSALNRLLTAERDLKQTNKQTHECAVYDSPPHVCFKLAEAIEDMLRKSISQVNQGLTHINPVPPVLVTYD